MQRRLAVLGVPSRAGSRSAGVASAPAALRAAGLVAGLRAAGAEVEELGDVDPPADGGGDPPTTRGLGTVVAVARAVAARVASAQADGRCVFVLGGDCTITLGVVAGLRAPVALLYLDGDLDLNTPATSPSGYLDGMGAAHLLGRGVPELVGLAGPGPLVAEERLAFLGYDLHSRYVDAAERVTLATLVCPRFPVTEVRRDPHGVAVRALERVAPGARSLLVHLDVDATDLPAADLAHEDVLPWATAATVLRTAARVPGFAGIVLTELNPERDPHGDSVARAVEALVDACR